jgi:hypothetical protein
MMMDGKGALMLWGIPTALLLLVGLALKGAGVVSNWWIIIGLAAVPTVLVIALFVFLILGWMARGSH